jgi:hypothetical protein
VLRKFRWIFIILASIILLPICCFGYYMRIIIPSFAERQVSVDVSGYRVAYVQAPDWDLTEYGFQITRSDGYVAYEGWDGISISEDTCDSLLADRQQDRVYFRCTNIPVTSATPFLMLAEQRLYVQGERGLGVLLRELDYQPARNASAAYPWYNAFS